MLFDLAFQMKCKYLMYVYKPDTIVHVINVSALGIMGKNVTFQGTRN